MHHDVRLSHEPANVAAVADVASELLDRALELGVVERHDVECPDVVTVGEEPPREVKPQKPGAAGDRPQHRGRLTGGIEAPR